jgi:hypothetical protein
MDFFRPNIEKSITLPSPPLRDEDEISRMKDIIRNRTAEDVQSIRDHDEVPFYALKKYCEENGLIFHENEFNELIEQSAPIIMHFKNMFNRKRPNEIDNKINTLPSKTNKTPSYPSGHSTQARLVARYVAGKFPEHEIELLKKGNECGMGRVRAGFHYPTDNETGILLGEKLYVFLNKDNYEN